MHAAAPKSERILSTAGASGENLDATVNLFGFNPSSWRQRVPVCLLATAAFSIALYLATYQWGWISTIWDPIFGDQTARVLDSDVSHQLQRWLVIPDAALGALGYLGDAVFGLAGSTRRWQYRPWLVILFGIDVIPLGIVSVVLVALQGTVVGSWCFLCLITAVISLVLIYWAYDEVWTSLVYLHRIRRESKSWSQAWRALWGYRVPVASPVADSLIGGR